MSLAGDDGGGEGDGFPRVSGDEPSHAPSSQAARGFSPRERG